MKQAGLDCKINHIKSNEYESKVKRPMNSRLSKKSILENKFKLLPEWPDALARYLKELFMK